MAKETTLCVCMIVSCLLSYFSGSKFMSKLLLCDFSGKSPSLCVRVCCLKWSLRIEL